MIPIRGLRAPVMPSAPPPEVQRKPGRPPMWTPARDKLLTSLWHQGKTAKEIADSFCEPLSRNAVIGRARRIGLPNKNELRRARHG